jgi:hypothetical protein
VRALFTYDVIITTAWNTIGLCYGDTAEPGTWDVNGSEFRRLAGVHGGEDMTVLGTPIQVGDNTVAFGFEWSSGVSGTALLHLRDGKIVMSSPFHSPHARSMATSPWRTRRSGPTSPSWSPSSPTALAAAAPSPPDLLEPARADPRREPSGARRSTRHPPGTRTYAIRSWRRLRRPC